METIVFCVPGTTFSWRFLSCWTATLQWCQSNGINVILKQAIGANIYEVRNRNLDGVTKYGPSQKPFQDKIKYDYIMNLDSDQVWTIKDFQKILSTMRKHPSISALTGVYCRVTDTENSQTTIMKFVNNKTLNYSYRLMSCEEVSDLQELSKVDAAGLGFCMFRYGVFEQLEFPWYRPVGIIDLKDDKYIQAAGDDISLFIDLKEIGIELWCDNTVNVGHEKTRVFYGGVI